MIEFVEDRPGHDIRYAIDGSLMERELKWKPSTEFHIGLEKTVDWYILNEDWWRPIINNVYDGSRLGSIGKKQDGER